MTELDSTGLWKMTARDSNMDWKYCMRREAQEIIPGLFLGPYSAAVKSQFETLLALGITHVICVRHESEAHFIKPNFPDNFKYLVLDVSDKNTENIMQYFSIIKQYIDDCLSSGGKVLIHGNSGISRSAAFAMAYLMPTFGIGVREALLMVQSKRLCVNPNAGFLAQLKEYEPIYQATESMKDISPHRRLLKRPLEDSASDFPGKRQLPTSGL